MIRAAIPAFIVVGVVAATVRAHGAPPPGTDMDSPVAKWFQSQHQLTSGMSCCGLGDGHTLDDDEWRESGDHYQVRINGNWVDVPARGKVDPAGGPNPTGKAVVWYTLFDSNFPVIFCFLPGTMM